MAARNQLKFIILIIFAALLLVQCSPESSQKENLKLIENQAEIIEYFKEVALGFEFGGPEITRKWNRDILILVGGEENETLQNELNDIVEELNGLISDENVQLIITTDSLDHNFYVFFGPGKDYEEINPEAEGYTDDNFGFFYVNTNISDNIIRGSMYVDTERPDPRRQLHLLREELTQSLGLAKDSDRYSDSIFNADYAVAVTEYSEVDKALIRLLYHPKMSAGLDSTEVDSVLKEIAGVLIE